MRYARGSHRINHNCSTEHDYLLPTQCIEHWIRTVLSPVMGGNADLVVDAQPGDVIFHSGLTLHTGYYPPTAEETRFALCPRWIIGEAQIDFATFGSAIVSKFRPMLLPKLCQPISLFKQIFPQAYPPGEPESAWPVLAANKPGWRRGTRSGGAVEGAANRSVAELGERYCSTSSEVRRVFERAFPGVKVEGTTTTTSL